MVFMRKDPLVEGQVYHIFSKSIAEFKIFNDKTEYSRMLTAIRYYQREIPFFKLSEFLRKEEAKEGNLSNINLLPDKDKLVGIIAYCIMPTHLHLILKQLKENGISIFMSNTFNSYTRYFNTRHNRKGPLWEGRFKSVLVETDEQLLHLTRYIHLNPVTAYLVNNPEEWPLSSYEEYISKTNIKICEYSDILEIEPESYKNFVLDRVSYQRELAKIKDLLLE